MQPERRVRKHDDIDSFDHRIAEILYYRHRWRWRMLFVWIIGFTVVAFYLYHANLDRINDIQANRKERIAQIQQSREQSCRDNYDGIYLAFVSLFPGRGDRTPRQQRMISEFRLTTDTLKQKCPAQIKLENGG